MNGRPLILDSFIPYRLSITSNLVSARIARAYEALFGLTIAEWRLVAVVAEIGSTTQQAIGVRTRMDKVTVSRAAIALVERGLLERSRQPGDGRSHLLTLTAAGGDLYAQVVPKALELERRIFGQLDAAEIDQFMATLRRIDDAATLIAADEG